MVSVESPPIVTVLHRAGSAHRLPVDRIFLRSSGGYGVGRPSVIARQPSEQHLPPPRCPRGPRPWRTCSSRPRPTASLPIADTRSTLSTKHSSALTSSVSNTRPLPTIIGQMVAARGADESAEWRQPADLIALCEKAATDLPALFAVNRDRRPWLQH